MKVKELKDRNGFIFTGIKIPAEGSVVISWLFIVQASVQGLLQQVFLI